MVSFWCGYVAYFSLPPQGVESETQIWGGICELIAYFQGNVLLQGILTKSKMSLKDWDLSSTLIQLGILIILLIRRIWLILLWVVLGLLGAIGGGRSLVNYIILWFLMES